MCKQALRLDCTPREDQIDVRSHFNRRYVFDRRRHCLAALEHDLQGPCLAAPFSSASMGSHWPGRSLAALIMLPMIGTRQVHYSELKFFVQRLGRDHRSRMLAVFAVAYRRIVTIVEHKDSEAGHIIWRRPADYNDRFARPCRDR